MTAAFDHLDEIKDSVPNVNVLPPVLRQYIENNTNLFLEPLADIGFVTRQLSSLKFAGGRGQLSERGVVLSDSDMKDLLRHYALVDEEFSNMLAEFKRLNEAGGVMGDKQPFSEAWFKMPWDVVRLGPLSVRGLRMANNKPLTTFKKYHVCHYGYMHLRSNASLALSFLHFTFALFIHFTLYSCYFGSLLRSHTLQVIEKKRKTRTAGSAVAVEWEVFDDNGNQYTKLYYGRIQYFLTHCFFGVEYKLAYINLYKEVQMPATWNPACGTQFVRIPAGDAVQDMYSEHFVDVRSIRYPVAFAQPSIFSNKHVVIPI